MRRIANKYFARIAVMALLLLTCCMTVSASQDDNSLYDLGITTEGVEISPEFQYDVWSYDVKVPAGTTELALSPVPSSDAATVADISGTTLSDEGNATIYITVRSGSGSEFTYTLNVTTDPSLPGSTTAAEPAADTANAAAEPVQTPETTPPQTETQAPQTEPETEPATEDSRYVRVDKNAIQEAEDTITRLKEEITGYRETVSLYTKIMYALIAAAVILLFFVINLILRKRDLKAELKDYQRMGYAGAGKGGKGSGAGHNGAPVPVQQRGGQGQRPGQGAPQSQGATQGRNARQGARQVPGQAARQGARPMQGQAAQQGVRQNQAARQGGGAAHGQMAQPGTGLQQGRVPQQGARPVQGQMPQYYPQGGQLDVMPQTSQGRSRRLPAYEGANQRPEAAAQNQAAAQQVQANPATAQQVQMPPSPEPTQVAQGLEEVTPNARPAQMTAQPIQEVQSLEEVAPQAKPAQAAAQEVQVSQNLEEITRPTQAEQPIPPMPEPAQPQNVAEKAGSLVDVSEPEVTMVEL